MSGAMSDINREIRRSLLKPLVHQSQLVADRKAIIKALGRLDNIALGNNLLGQLRDVVSSAQSDKTTKSWGDLVAAAKEVALAKALYDSRRISTQEYVFFAVSPVASVHDKRWMDGEYQKELGPISRAIDAIQKEHGLESDEFWPRDEGPKEYTRLNIQYESILDMKFLGVLREFGLHDIADLKEHNPKEYERLWERGRRSVFHRDEDALAIRDIVIRYEKDASLAASVKAYSAAVVSLGAGIEGLLLLRCLRSMQKACRLAKKLPRRLRPKYPGDPTKWTFEALIEVCLKAGWLPPVETSVARYNTAGLAHILRLMRNHVHPGRHAREKPWSETDEREYQDATSIYVVLLSTLGKVRRHKAITASNKSMQQTRKQR